MGLTLVGIWGQTAFSDLKPYPQYPQNSKNLCGRQSQKAEFQTIDSALGKEFPQKAELELTRENHAAVIRELQRMQDDPEYVSEWEPKKLEKIETETQGITEKVQTAPQKLIYGTPEKRTEYTVSTQHNGYEMEGHVLRRTYFDNQVGSIGQSFYTDGQWHTTENIPQGIKIMQFPDAAMALNVAKEDASRNGLSEIAQNPRNSATAIITHTQPITENLRMKLLQHVSLEIIL